MENTPRNKLPKLGNAFRFLLYMEEPSQKNATLNSCISATVNEVLLIWEKVGIKTVTRRNAQHHLKNVRASLINILQLKN